MTHTTAPAGSEQATEAAREAFSRIGRRVGYLIAAVLNGVGLWIANQLLAWEWPPFLTEDFEAVVPLISASFILGIVTNAAYAAYDSGWFKSSTQIVANGVALAVAIRLYQVFPFDFSPYDFDWGLMTRIALVVGMVGIGIGTVVEAAKLARLAKAPPKRR